MPRIQRPYYNLHQITTGQYSEGGEFILSSGEIYTGAYHILPTGQKFTEFVPTQKSVELFELRLIPNMDMLTYNKVMDLETNKYVVPFPIQPAPNQNDYKRGKIERFFVQKRNNPLYTILEIDSQQYNSINTQNRPGINGTLWNKLKIVWIISKIPIEDAKYQNTQTLQIASRNFGGIGNYITNALEFYK
jgi:hypothetical protein